MEQRRRQPVWKAESRRKREKRIARLRRRIIAYTVRGIVAAVLAVMLLLMVCGCLYIRDFFRKDHKESALKADSVREAVPGVEENKPDTEFPEQEKYTVVLDAGHGGEDGGTVEQTATEKEINLAVVLKMRELLENQGICVVLTREQDIFIKLEERVRVANGEKADLFVSIHCNYYEKDSSIYGLECYYCKGAEDGKYYAERILETIEKSGEIVSRNAKPSGYYILKIKTAWRRDVTENGKSLKEGHSTYDMCWMSCFCLIISLRNMRKYLIYCLQN